MLLLKRKRRKVFVIGRNKTGTTSVAEALRSMGFRLGNQAEAEVLMEDWVRRDFAPIVKYCKTADAFQDVPFSNDYTYQVVDYAFPRSQFILSVRSSAEEWYESVVRFHTLLIGKNRRPTADDLKQFAYRKTMVGWIWRTQQVVYGVDESTVYDKATYVEHYEQHNKRVLDYFRYRPEDLLVLNVSDPDAMLRMCAFLGVKAASPLMPHLNRST